MPHSPCRVKEPEPDFWALDEEVQRANHAMEESGGQDNNLYRALRAMTQVRFLHTKVLNKVKARHRKRHEIFSD